MVHGTLDPLTATEAQGFKDVVGESGASGGSVQALRIAYMAL